MKKAIAVSAMLATLLLVPVTAAFAQDGYWQSAPNRDYGHRPRGSIRVTNDWRDQVKVTLWTHQRERIGDFWVLESGETVFLAVDETRIRVRPTYKIKVGEDWGWVNLGDVGEFSRGVWSVNVRDIWRATHQRGGRNRPTWRNDDVPDWQR